MVQARDDAIEGASAEIEVLFEGALHKTGERAERVRDHRKKTRE